MRIKKEYIGLALVIIVLSIYLFMRDTDRTHYELPVLEPIEQSSIDRFEISRPEGRVILSRSGEGWIIEPEGFPAAPAKVDEMLGAVENLTATSLVSESKNYAQYDLGDDTKITVEAYGGGSLLRRLDVGKAASTYRHTYVLLEGDPRVYQVSDNIRRAFETKLDQLRDRGVHAVDRADVTAITLLDASERLDLEKVTRGLEPSAEAGMPPTPVVAWVTADSLEADGAAVDQLLGRIVNVQADGFPEGLTKAELVRRVGRTSAPTVQRALHRLRSEEGAPLDYERRTRRAPGTARSARDGAGNRRAKATREVTWGCKSPGGLDDGNS